MDSVVLAIANMNLAMAIIIVVTFFAIAISTTDDKYDDNAIDFRNSHGKVYATSRTEQLFS